MTHPVARMVLLCGLTATATAAWAQAPVDDREGRDGRPRRPVPMLSATGRAEVSVEPDQAVVRLGAVAQAQTAGEAQDQVNRTVQKVLEAVRGLDVRAESIQTQHLVLSPVYSQQRPPRNAEGEPEEPRIVGYRASNSLQIKLDDIKRAGKVIDAGIAAGANQLEGLSFSVKDDTEAKSKALAQAIASARTKAQAMAEAMQVRLDGVAEVVEGGYEVRPPMPMLGARMREMAMAAATPIEPGQVDISASVTVTYFIAPAGGQDRPALQGP